MKKYNLWIGEDPKHAICLRRDLATEEDAYAAFVAQQKISFPQHKWYTRMWKEGNITHIDFGSYNYFFFIEEKEVE